MTGLCGSASRNSDEPAMRYQATAAKCATFQARQSEPAAQARVPILTCKGPSLTRRALKSGTIRAPADPVTHPTGASLSEQVEKRLECGILELSDLGRPGVPQAARRHYPTISTREYKGMQYGWLSEA